MSHQDHQRGGSQMDPALARGLTMPRMSRRELFRYAGVGVGALGLSALLEACGTKGVTSSGSSAQASAGVGSQEWWAKQTLHHQLNFANWPYYIDTAHGKHPSIEQFQQKTGIQVNYTEPIDDNVTFYQSKLRPVLQAGQPTGYDIVVLTNNDWPLSQMMELGWLIPLNHEMMKNFDQYASDLVKDPTWDPGNKYTMAWQSGYTCLGYNTKYVKEPVTSVQILWDEKYAGKIGMFANAGELGSIGLLALGIDPATSTPDDWKKAADKLQQQKDAGIVRSYYDQDYIKALKNEDIWISQVWSGDVFQAATYQGYPQLKIAIPDEGAMFWTDNMCIPLLAENPLDAMTYMDYVYDPQVQALIEDYNAYVCPVPAAKEIIARQLKDPTVANSPTVFPDAHMQSLSRNYYQFKNNEELTEWNNLFVPIFQ